MSESISGKVVRNTFFNIAGYFWGALVTIVLTPYILSNIGAERYGILVVAGIVSGYFGLLDLGISTSFVKYISEFYARKEYDRINSVIVTGTAFYALFSSLAAGLGIWFSGEIIGAMRVPAELATEGEFCLRTALIIFLVTNVFSGLNSLQRGLQRMDVTLKISVAAAVVNMAGIVAVLESGFGLPAIMLVNLGAALVKGGLDSMAARSLLPSLSLRPVHLSAEMFRKQFFWGYNLQIARVSGMISAHLDKLLIIFFLSPDLVAMYQLGWMVALYAVSGITLISGALVPAFSEAFALGKDKAAAEAYFRGTVYTGTLAFPVFVFLAAAAPEIMFLWVGEGYADSVLVLRILSAGWLINTVLGAIGTPFVQGAGKPQIQMRGALLNVILNPVLSVLLLLKLGFTGLMIGTSAAISIGAVYFTLELRREFGFARKDFLRDVFILPGLAAGLPGLLVWIAPLDGLFTQALPVRVSALAAVLLQALFFSGFYLAALRFFVKPFRRDELSRIFEGRFPAVRAMLDGFCRA